MGIKHPYEFWCTDKDGKKHHKYFNYSSTRASKVEEYIEKTYGINIESCIDFGFRRNHDI
jgi:hypothetical protein